MPLILVPFSLSYLIQRVDKKILRCSKEEKRKKKGIFVRVLVQEAYYGTMNCCKTYLFNLCPPFECCFTTQIVNRPLALRGTFSCYDKTERHVF